MKDSHSAETSKLFLSPCFLSNVGHIIVFHLSLYNVVDRDKAYMHWEIPNVIVCFSKGNVHKSITEETAFAIVAIASAFALVLKSSCLIRSTY